MQDLEAKIVELARKNPNVPGSRIAEALGVSNSTARKYMRLNGLNRKHGRRSAEEIEFGLDSAEPLRPSIEWRAEAYDIRSNDPSISWYEIGKMVVAGRDNPARVKEAAKAHAHAHGLPWPLKFKPWTRKERKPNTERPCMCCGNLFKSEGKHNRLCYECKSGGSAPTEYALAGVSP